MREKPPRHAQGTDDPPSGGRAAAGAARTLAVREPARLLAAAGAAFALLPVPDQTGSTELAHIELLSPDRLVRYLARPLEARTTTALAEALIQMATEPYPEQTVPTVQDDTAGLAVLVKGSTKADVHLEFLVLDDLEADLPDHDGISFDAPRQSLVDMAHQLEEWQR